MKRRLFFWIGFFGTSFCAMSQDYLNTNLNHYQKILFVGVDSNYVHYKPWDLRNADSVYIVPVKLVNEVVLATGEIYQFNLQEELVRNQNRSAIKINALGPFLGSFTINYEQLVRPLQTVEVALGFIGMGVDINEINPNGKFVRAGYKFIFNSRNRTRNLRYSHQLKGFYFKPEFIYGSYFFTYNDQVLLSQNPYRTADVTTQQKAVFSALMFNLGYQWVFDDLWLFDFNFGLGSAYTKLTVLNETRTLMRPVTVSDLFNYAYGGGDGEIPIACSLSFKFGFLFNRKHEKK